MLISSRTIDAFLALTRLGLGNAGVASLVSIDWNELKDLAEQHGLSVILLDGINCLPPNKQLPRYFILQWIGEVLQEDEDRYYRYRRTIAEMAGFYNKHGFKMMVLKGYACSLDWPKPEHRPCGDIDIWQFGEQKAADASLAKEKGIKIDTSHHHHTVFHWNGFLVENHYDFINVHQHKSNAEYEKILKRLGEDDSHSVEVNGEKVYLPSPNLHALFLLKHLMLHFASQGMRLRQVADWGLFVEKHGKDVDWNYVLEVLDRFGMLQMFNIINAICVDDLGFDVASFPTAQSDPSLKDKVLNDILAPKYGPEPKGLFSRIVFKFRRWIGNEWKHRLCFKDSMWSAFWNGVWNHLLKPSSI